MDFGKRIAAAREAAGMTQQELADKLFVSRELVSKWEHGLRRPYYGTFLEIAEALSVKAEALITREEYAGEELEACVPEGCGLDRERLTELIARFISGLPEREAKLFMRRFFFLNSNAEIAELFDMKENKVRCSLSRTVARLGRFLKEECENERMQ